MWSVIISALSSIGAKFWKWIAGIAGAIAVLFYAYFSGRKSRQRQLENDNAETNKLMFEESTKAPKSKDDFLKKIRSKEGL